MFVSMPEYRFLVPPALSQPGATYWRSVGLTTTAAWFVLTIRPRAPRAPTQSFLLAWDTDVAKALSTLDADMEGLLFIAPVLRKDQRGWHSKRITEVWAGANPEQDLTECVILVGEDGVDYSGDFMEPAKNLTRSRLIAKVQPKRARQRSPAN
jgi:hypothetical protein